MLHIFLLTNFLLLFDKFSLVFVAESFNISLLLFVFQLLWCHMRKASVSGSGLTEGKFILSFAWLLERILTNFTHAFFQFSLISISPAFLAHCVTTYFLLVFFKLPLTLLLLQNISCRIPLVGLSQNYCKSYIIVLFNLLPCKYFDWFVELKELGNVCTMMCMYGVTQALSYPSLSPLRLTKREIYSLAFMKNSVGSFSRFWSLRIL